MVPKRLFLTKGVGKHKERLTSFELALRDAGIAIEGRTQWPRGGHSIYFRDPDGHLLELATPGLWKGY